ncbi:glycosyltransferase family 39 protein [Uliginosibacterium sp. 31-16]|uniref:ArnT family glycosyltransferase n=1 Tax=Uliginosibacterium sp. 31-16 TaxID=3068315 RepID=UPI00273F14D9|nr:glycosyltransferase family 39 protein [Uliginosibacterium sp. 31-16]MDP5239892.1 glycosyltransferase family 39 protein [Uliginosibacterium sp. 31-16]
MEDWTRIRMGNEKPEPSTSLPQPLLLLLLLVLLTTYRLWVIPRLGVTLYIDEAQYWTWAQDLDWGYFSKPPVIAWLIAASTAIFGDGLLAVKLPALLLYPATAWLLFLLGQKLFDVRVGFRAGLAFALIPIVSALGLAISTDAPLLFCWTAAMLCLLRAIERDRMRDWLWMGAAVGVGIMAKYTMAAFAASAVLYLLLDRRRRHLFAHPGLWAAIALACVIVLPNILWNWAHDFPTLRHTADITHVSSNDKGGNLGEFLLAQIGSLGPGFALAFFGGLVLATRKWRDPRYQFLLCFSLPLLGLVFAQALRSEANGNWAAPALLTALLLGVVQLSRMRSRWWMAALGLNLVLMFGAYHLGDYFRLTSQVQPARLDPLKRAKGWSQLAAQVRPLLVSRSGAILLTSDRTMMAHLLYELRDLQTDHLAWAPNQHPGDHYQLTTPLTEEPSSRPLLLVTQDDDFNAISERFTKAEALALINIEVEPGLKRHAKVILLEGFKGYPRAAE